MLSLPLESADDDSVGSVLEFSASDELDELDDPLPD
jgi:hypothetical protein